MEEYEIEFLSRAIDDKEEQRDSILESLSNLEAEASEQLQTLINEYLVQLYIDVSEGRKLVDAELKNAIKRDLKKQSESMKQQVALENEQAKADHLASCE